LGRRIVEVLDISGKVTGMCDVVSTFQQFQHLHCFSVSSHSSSFQEETAVQRTFFTNKFPFIEQTIKSVTFP
jgi:hypothetical protein